MRNRIYLTLIIAMLILSACIGKRQSSYKTEIPEPLTVIDTVILESMPAPDDWDAFIEALIDVESKGDSAAVGTKNDVGVLQITPILLDDANRILGEERYTLDDRTDREKSIEIFNIIQNHYNPDHDLHYALKIWNSKAPISYHRSVMAEYNKLRHTWN